MENNNPPMYAVVTEDGKVICITGSDTVEALPIERVTADNLFTHYRCDLEDFKEYVKSLEGFNIPKNPFSRINIDGCSFLEVTINRETGELVL